MFEKNPLDIGKGRESNKKTRKRGSLTMNKLGKVGALSLLLGSALVPVMSVEVSASTPNAEEDFEFSNGVITGYTGDSKDVVIPSTIGGVEVREIGRNAFHSYYLTSVKIPNSVTSIRQTAFYNNSLTSITIPDSVTSIGFNAFHPSSPLTTADVPIYGLEGGPAETYANANGHPFIPQEEGNGGSSIGTQEAIVNINGGALSMAVNEVTNFSSVTLGKGVHSLSTGFTGNFTIADKRGSGEGWGLQVSATPFSRVERDGSVSEVHRLHKGSLVLGDLVGVLGKEGSEALPEGSIKGLGVVIDSDVVPVINVEEGSGKGLYAIEFGEGGLELYFKSEDVLLHPGKAETYYVSTLRWDLLSAPM